MNPARTAILLGLGLLLLLLVARRLHRMQLKERHAIIFILTAAPFLVLAVWPDLIATLSRWLDISYSTVLLMGVSVFLTLMIFELLSIVSVLERKVSTLAQMVSILNEKHDLSDRDAVGDSSAQ